MPIFSFSRKFVILPLQIFDLCTHRLPISFQSIFELFLIIPNIQLILLQDFPGTFLENAGTYEYQLNGSGYTWVFPTTYFWSYLTTFRNVRRLGGFPLCDILQKLYLF